VFLVMPRGVPILFSRLLVLLRSLHGHGRSSRARWCHPTTRFPPQEVDTLHVPSCALFFGHVPWRGITADLVL
jgi:hypothetical protein